MPEIPPPTDIFTTQVSSALDRARGVLADVGLRPYRVFLVRQPFQGPMRREGAPGQPVWVEILPSPKVSFISAARVASSGGLIQEGSVEVSQISRSYQREDLLGITLGGDPIQPNESFHWALLPIGQPLAELYNPASDAILEPTQWKIILRPINRRLNPWTAGP